MDKVEKLKRSGGFRRRVIKYKKIYLTNVPTSAANVSNAMSSSRTSMSLTDYEEDDTAENLEIVQVDSDSDSNESTVDCNTSKVDRDFDFRDQLRNWSIDHNIPHTAINGLLQIINKHDPGVVPKDARTLLKTVKSVDIEPCGSGEYWHNGFKKNIVQHFENLDKNINLCINVNIDGLPTYKSSKVEFWPILCNIHGMNTVPVMTIGIYCGVGKPQCNEFLKPFVTEMKEILQNGIEINNYLITIKLQSFICDSPARAFIKNIANFNSQNGCPKCTAVGEYSYDSHCNVYPRREFPERTDEGFRNKIYEDHHKGDTILTELPIDMILDFPVSDSLHLIDLGIMKRCLLGWRDGSFRGYRTKWSANDNAIISRTLVACKLPKEIHRACRGLDCLAFWKASEFSTFVHYLGVVILKKFVQPDAYDHFLLLFCATTICSSSAYSALLGIAEVMLKHYIEYYGDIYGEAHITSNVHNLSHIVQEVRRFGPLQSFNAYPFENELYNIKRLLRTGTKPLQQAAKRIIEKSQMPVIFKSHEETKYPKLKGIIERPDDFNVSLLSEEEQSQSSITLHTRIEFKNFVLSKNNYPDSWFLTIDNDIVKFECAVSVNKNLYCYGLPVIKKEQFFSKPIQSSHLNIYVSDSQTSGTSIICALHKLKCKLVVVSYSQNEHVFMPLIHTLKE